MPRFLEISLRTPARCLRFAILLSVLSMPMGCIWHGDSIDHFWGPTFFRVGGPPDNHAFLAEQASLPVLVEGGNRWGITIGYFSRLLSVPISIDQTDGQAAPPASSFLWHSPAAIPMGSWRMSPFHVSIERFRKVEFVVKRVVGIQLSTGVDREGSNFTIGTSHTTAFWPGPNALYLLEFSGRNPSAIRFLVCDAKRDASLEPCIEEVVR